MNAAFIKDVFFFIGSLLGILAFFKTVIEPLLEGNRRRWAEVKTKLDENDIRDLAFDVSMARRVDCELLDRLHGLVRDIEEDAEYVRFGPLLRRRYTKHLTRFIRAYHDLRKYIRVPYWEPNEIRRDDGSKWMTYEFQKAYFFEDEYHGISYDEHLGRAENIVGTLRLEFRALSVLSDIHVVELPFVRWLLPKRVQLPSDRDTQNKTDKAC